MATDVTTTTRALEAIVPATSTLEGGGSEVHPPFPPPDADWFDPLLPPRFHAVTGTAPVGDTDAELSANHLAVFQRNVGDLAIDDFNADRMSSIPASGRT